MAKKFSVKKLILLIILVLIIGGTGFIANAFKGNPISKHLAKNEYKKYVQETYPDTDFKVNKAYYNFKDGKYYAEVISEIKKLNFNLSRRYDDVINDEYRDQATLIANTVARRFMDKIIDETMREITEVNGIALVKDIYVNMEFEQGKYNEDIEFTKDIEEEFKIQVNLKRESIKNGEKEESKDKKTKEEMVLVIDDQLIDIMYEIKNIIINMEYKGLTEVGFGFVDSNYNYQYILLDKENFNIPKEELIKFKTKNKSIYDKVGDVGVLRRKEEDLRVTLKDVKNIEELRINENTRDGSFGNEEVYMKILKETKPTKEELAKEAFNIKELIKKQYPEVKYLNIEFYEYVELNAKGGNWGQYYGSIFIGNEFAPWKITEEEVNTKLKTWNKL